MKDINPNFEHNNPLNNPELFRGHLSDIQQAQIIPHAHVLGQLLEQIQPVDFRELAGLDSEEKPKANHFYIITVEQVLLTAKQNKWGICQRHDFTYLYNGSYWSLLESEDLKAFLGKAAEKLGVDRYKAIDYRFREHLHKQFMASANLPSPEQADGKVLVNLQNGTFEITAKGTALRAFNRNDFLTYQLPFEYSPKSKAPLFEQYLNKVLPDGESQNILAEYLGGLFIHRSHLKLEKALLLYGTGANGKSVFFEVVNALLGHENVSSYSLQSLTNENGYFRAKLANTLVNYASEINGKLEASIFKQLVSGEPVEARLPYGNPFTLTDYAKLIFNCNELPREVEHTNAFFRRFLIIPFGVTIPEKEQDKELSKKIIQQELSGVFNWLLKGLDRLLKQKKFSHCKASEQALNDYEKESDSTKLFLEEMEYSPSPTEYAKLKDLYIEYRTFCIDDGFRAVSKSNFIKRLQNARILIEKKGSLGNVVYLTSPRQNRL